MTSGDDIVDNTTGTVDNVNDIFVDAGGFVCATGS